MRAGDLTTLANVKAWLQITTTDPVRDALMMRLIASASAFILQQINRTGFGYGQISRTYDGSGQDFMVLRDYPVQSIVSIGMAGHANAITAAGSLFPFAKGYMLDPPAPSIAGQRLALVGDCFPRVRGGVVVTYMAGYVATEQYVIPASPFQITVGQLWTADVDVTTGAGIEMTQVAAMPGQGQYVAADGVYTFNAADVGTEVSIRYSYIPADIEQVACELVGLRVKTQGRIGVSSQSLAGKESITYFAAKDLNGVMQTVLQPYKSVVPY